MKPLLPPPCSLRLPALLALVLAVSGPVRLAATAGPEDPMEMDPLLVPASSFGRAGTDEPIGAGMFEEDDPPFTNALLIGFGDGEDELTQEIVEQQQAAAAIPPVDLATGISRVDLRGFPTPRLRNGFTQSGVPEILGVERNELIQGPLTPVTGQAAPGGIQNAVTLRPRTRNTTRIDASVTARRVLNAGFDTSRVVVPKKAWSRVLANIYRKDGPEEFAFRETRNVSGALYWRHSGTVSSLVQFDYQTLRANASPGIPEYRLTTGAKIVGPYLPLAEFHAYGPNASTHKRLGSASGLLEARPNPNLTLRAGVQGFWRMLNEERWTTSQYIVDTGKFGGTREPQHQEQPLQALTGQAEATWRYLAIGAEHKLLVSAGHSLVRSARMQRGLDAAGRAELPADVLTFDPEEPNWFRPAYSEELFNRVITDRVETTGYSSALVSERAAFAKGRFVATLGLRFDQVDFSLDDHRPGNTRPHAEDTTSEGTWLLGANYLVRPNQLLLFGNASRAFQPSTRIDARTGRLQGNASTQGLELGAKGIFLSRKLNVTALAFAFQNQNISRRNPLYNDPIQDAHLTQPELVAEGEEDFTGGTLDLRGQVTPAWSLSGRASFTRAITTASPDLPEEEGRALTRVPRFTASVQSRYQFDRGAVRGLAVGGGLTYVSDYVVSYESSSREHLEYPAIMLASVNVSYRWRTANLDHSVSLSSSNFLNRDLLTSVARVGAGRDVGLKYGVSF
ncbi:TonB-dependent receptor [Opitutaceae bacterium]